ncbi:MAG TPA: polyphosphate kinase 1 [Thermoanaerobaculia bacterium]|nr:polyphosphate kinase 1 [Thermoanaerobaculia bacterium]
MNADANREISLPGDAIAPLTSPGTVKMPPIAVPALPVRLFNREFSWIEFNRRVLAEAEDPDVPLLERVKFLSIAANNLDEFLMVRVGAIRDLVTTKIQERSPDGMTPKQQLKGIRDRVTSMMDQMYRCFDTLMPELRKVGIRIETFDDLSKKEQAALKEHFEQHISPILTPLAVDPGHPFPFLASRSVNMAILLETERGEPHISLLKIPPQVPRLISVGDSGPRFIPVEALIEMHLSQFFRGLRLRKMIPFRVIRNADILLQEDEVQDLLKSVETELRRRERKEVVWIEIAGDSESLVSLLSNATRTTQDDIFIAPAFLKLSDLMEIYQRLGKGSLKEPPFNPRIPPQLATSDDIFSILRRGDLLLHRPYDSFTAVVEFVQAASEDPDVLAIKMTLYRTDTPSPIVEALASAAERGKQVTAIVELQARFDESKNIAWARRLEEAGVQVVYGLVGIKTHCKVCLVIRREGSLLRRYVHLSTGNYNANTARIYTDIDLFTTDEAFGDDASQVMNLLTGYSIASIQDVFDKAVTGWQWKRLIVSPIDFHEWALRMVEREIRHAKEGRAAQILLKMNALVDRSAIEKLYEASQAGVRVDLIIRGICCLVPDVPDLSTNIRVVSIVDRFLEHSRIMLFRNGGDTEVYVSSGDWMPRNFFRRIELTYPILAEPLKKRLESEILANCLADNVKAWKLNSEGTYKRRSSGETRVRSQERFIEIARSEAVRLGPYEETISHPGPFRRKAKRPRKKK